ncbi:hypothetical protein ACLGIH_33380 [Streptomyces sp. HMX87]|uniref:hypothetical protein n=1 Tax=Streptomyces sp. HMX87 TaxID=3390849 RepID=UPI003A844B06
MSFLKTASKRSRVSSSTCAKKSCLSRVSWCAGPTWSKSRGLCCFSRAIPMRLRIGRGLIGGDQVFLVDDHLGRLVVEPEVVLGGEQVLDVGRLREPVELADDGDVGRVDFGGLGPASSGAAAERRACR